MPDTFSLIANYVSIKNKTINSAEIFIQDEKIISLKNISEKEAASLSKLLDKIRKAE